jgi:inosine-uridine nucleoside N-ribohydrolase
MAYLFFNGGLFNVVGVTVNATYNGGAIESHKMEAERVMKLCNVFDDIPLYIGANKSYNEIVSTIEQKKFEGWGAVIFIIDEAHKPREQKLVLLPIGKLTNVALALKKDPSIASKVRIVWLGSNYPKRGEYNKENDVEALNYILSVEVPFEMVTVRYGSNTGTGHVYVTQADILSNMPGLGPKADEVEGRHGGLFTSFGDYSVNLFEHCDFYGEPPHRSLFDMAAVAILKNPSWAQMKVIGAPRLIENGWEEQLDNQRRITIWENFDKDLILGDFFETMKNHHLTTKE